MKVLIIGAGETGFHIASEFSEGNYNVTVVDEHPEHLTNIQQALNIAGVHGSGTSIQVLESAGIDSTDLLIACTDHDETNLICCLLASQYKVKKTVALTKTASFLNKDVIKRYIRSGITQVINSSLLTAQEIIATATLASATEVSAFGEQNVLLVGYKVKEDSPWNGLQLKDIKQPDGENHFLVASIVRNGQSFIPTGLNRIEQGDYVYLLIAKKSADLLNNLLNVRISAKRKAIIAGDNQIAERVAWGLLKSHYQVTMICRDELYTVKMKKCFSHKKKLQVIQGDCELVKLQLQQGVSTCSLFIAVNNDDHLNISSSMVAKYLGVSKTICLVNRQDLISAASSVNLDVILSPRLNTARQVKKIIRGSEQSLNFTTISETNMEVIEMIASPTSRVLGIPLKDLKLPKNTLVGALLKDKNRVTIPTGNTIIEEADKVVFVSTPEQVPLLQQIIEEKEGAPIFRE
jgi:trk system potassium uptake protein TrkA